jgi:hypothetical protein
LCSFAVSWREAMPLAALSQKCMAEDTLAEMEGLVTI